MKNGMKRMVFASLWIGVMCAAGISAQKPGAQQQGMAEGGLLRMATTTSTDNSGLLNDLLPKFKNKTGIDVQVIAVGTGKAIKHGENGDVDLVFVHARKAEDEFVAKGFGVNRKDVMYNDFVFLGPKSDPAGIGGAKDCAKAFGVLAKKQAAFVSRGDESGTHIMEKDIWKAAGVQPSGSWYMQAGQGMGAVLVIADEKQAYTIADRGTFIAYEDKLNLKIVCEGDARLANPYGIIAVNPDKHGHVKYREAMQFIDWIVSAQGRQAITGFKVKGKQLFFTYPEKK